LDLEPFRIGVATLAEIEVEPADIEAGLRKLETVVAEVSAKGMIPLTLGGEHSLTLAPVAALRELYPGMAVLQMDAHLDLRDAYQGTKLSHASVMRRVCERRQVVGCDIVELCPIPGQPASDFFAAKLANKLIGYLGLGPEKEPGGEKPEPRAASKPRRRSSKRRKRGR